MLCTFALGFRDLRAISTTNLLVNPGAETGTLSGWTTGGNSNPFVDNGSFNPGINPRSGSYDFVGGTGSFGSLTQAVSLVGNQGITAGLIDSGTLFANLSFWEQGLNQGATSDHGHVTLTFLDASNGQLSTYTSPDIDSHDGTWENFATTLSVPIGTRTIDYEMDFIRAVGNDNDSYFDDNFLSIFNVGSAVPETGSTLGIFGMGLAGLIFCRRVLRSN